jgi:hypothetical protein
MNLLPFDRIMLTSPMSPEEALAWLDANIEPFWQPRR